MDHEVFLSYCPENKGIATLVCRAVEANGLCCWLRSRDLDTKRDNKKTVEEAIKAAKIMVILFSSEANRYTELASEMNIAINSDMEIIPVRIEMAEPEGVMQYYLADTQWFDVTNPPSEIQIQDLVAIVDQSLKQRAEEYRRKAKQREISSEKNYLKFGKPFIITFYLLSSIILVYGIIRLSLGVSRLVSGVENLFSTIAGQGIF